MWRVLTRIALLYWEVDSLVVKAWVMVLQKCYITMIGLDANMLCADDSRLYVREKASLYMKRKNERNRLDKQFENAEDADPRCDRNPKKRKNKQRKANHIYIPSPITLANSFPSSPYIHAH